MAEFAWRTSPPGLDEVTAEGGVAHYWARGWNFNRPVIAKVAVSARANPPESFLTVISVGDVEVMEPTTSPRFTNLEMLPGWAPLEWAGPIPEPIIRE